MRTKSANTRPWVSILMLVGFLTILVTGILSYALRYNSFLSALHTVFGLLFVGYGILHLKNNFKPLKTYFNQRNMRYVVVGSFLLVPMTVIGLLIGLPPFQSIIDVGYALKELKAIDRQTNTTLYTRFESSGRKLELEVKAGEHYSGPGPKILGVTKSVIPQMAVWLEDIDGKFIETLYVTKKASDSSYLQGFFGEEQARRPEALPHWAHSRGVREDDGLLMPSADQPIADALTGATPLSSFELQSVTTATTGELVVKLEINRSFDFNEVYHPGAFPDDPIYSGSGNSAQPSLIYAARIDLDQDTPYYFMDLIGHGHHSGKTGEVYPDFTGITTAKDMVKRAIVGVR
ncbi:MAG: hypothetical protein KTR16_08900 [Acidiferrobacterales bacterium]|nr:hypothetical protein [Acidiferrobacterales bacterium]